MVYVLFKSSGQHFSGRSDYRQCFPTVQAYPGNCVEECIDAMHSITKISREGPVRPFGKWLRVIVLALKCMAL